MTKKILTTLTTLTTLQIFYHSVKSIITILFLSSLTSLALSSIVFAEPNLAFIPDKCILTNDLEAARIRKDLNTESIRVRKALDREIVDVEVKKQNQKIRLKTIKIK